MTDESKYFAMFFGWGVLLIILIIFKIFEKDIKKEHRKQAEEDRDRWREFQKQRDEYIRMNEEMEARRIERMRNSPMFKDRPEAFEHWLHMEEVKKRIDEKNREKWYQKWHW